MHVPAFKMLCLAMLLWSASLLKQNSAGKTLLVIVAHPDDKLMVFPVLSKYAPVITWGPEGGYGHPYHRIVGAMSRKFTGRAAMDARHCCYFPVFQKKLTCQLKISGHLAENLSQATSNTIF